MRYQSKIKEIKVSFRQNIYSRTVALFIAIVFIVDFCVTLFSAEAVQKTQCLGAYDQFGYYSYLPATFIYDDLEFEKDWIVKTQDHYCYGAPIYQYADRENGKKVNIYHMGLSYLHLPGFLIADNLADNMGYKRDGMSKPYLVMVELTGLLFIFLGIYFLSKTLLLFFSDKVTALTLFLIYFASNSFVHFHFGELGPHLFLFTLNTIFIYYLIRYYRSKQLKLLVISALVFGLTTAIRPTQAIWGVIPFVIIFFENKEYWSSFKKLLFFPGFILLFNLPQFLYWKFFGGNWIILNLHSEALTFADPYTIDFLFSFKKGWLVYSPIFILSLIGIIYSIRKDKLLGRAFLFFVLLNIYVLSSWECWWYAASFGSRVMIDSYVVFAIFLGFFISEIKPVNWKKILVAFFCASFIILNLLQTTQFFRGIIPLDRMSKDHYLYIFGKLNFINYDESLMEIDRKDLEWPKKIMDKNSLAFKKGYRLGESRKVIFPSGIDFKQEEEFKGDQRIKVFDFIPTDEAQIEVKFHSQLEKDSTPVLLTLVIEKKNGTPYHFEYMELNQKDQQTVRIFNVPAIRHKSDIIKIYLWNPNKNKGKVSSIRLKAIYLKRT